MTLMETQMAMIIWSFLFNLVEQLTAQLESSMGMQSNLDAVRSKELVTQCPGEWQWACHNGECIARYDVCDGIPQCSDGSDEWNCDQWRQNNAFNKQGGGNAHTAATTIATSTTTVANTGFIVLSTREVLISFVIFAVLAAVVVMIVRRRARIKLLARNRRGNLLQKFQGDSDEDDILITSMYS